MAGEEGFAGEGTVPHSQPVSEIHQRAGTRALTLVSTPLNLLILRALAERPLRLGELRRATGLPAQTTLRGHLAELEEFGALSKKPTQRTSYAVENVLTAMGEDLLRVAGSLEHWLSRAPERPIALESGAAKRTVKALVDGWGSTMMRCLASRPMSLTELDREIAELSYPALERRLCSMRLAGLIEARPSNGSATPYAVTDWARRGAAPLAFASHCERTHMGDRAVAMTELDIETVFLLITPLVGLPEESSGTCQLEVEPTPRELREQSGVRVEVERGKVVACQCELGSDRESYAIGTTKTWFLAIKEGSLEELRFGGGSRFAESLVLGLHTALMKN
jgi:DNA-binding HxlR family transcriptional regulator